MAILFYAGKNDRPNRLYLTTDKVTIHDRIVFAEAYYSVDDKCLTFYGMLSPESIGIENSKDKTWKLDNFKQLVLLSFYKDKKPTWNNETGKFEDKKVDPAEEYLYTFCKDILKNFGDGKCMSAVIAPYVAPQFLEDMQVSQPENVIAYWETKNKNILVAVEVEPKYLNVSAAAEVLKTTSTSFGGGKTYQKPENENEKLEARWEFLKRHLGEKYPVNSLYELGALLAMEQSTPEGIEAKLTLSKTLELIAGMWK